MKTPVAILLTTALLMAGTAQARKVRTRLPAVKKESGETAMARGSQAISTLCETCAEGYSLADVAFSGYDKKNGADKESFFVVNKSDRTLTGLTLFITYLTVDSVQLHKRRVSVDCEVPPGGRYKVDIRSWDTQKSFHYYLSDAPRRKRSTPYIVYFDPITIYLRYKD